MGDFSVEWLTLREPADMAARSSAVTSAIADRLSRRSPIDALDLATGTGSNLRYLVDRLAGDQRWLLVDRDPHLLAALPGRMSAWSGARGHRIEREGDGWLVHRGPSNCRFASRCLDLDRVGPELLEGRNLVTTSALLDLVSASWLDLLTSECRRSGACVLFALTYDGRLQCSPDDDEDGRIRELVNRHQQTDKGFGLALGPAAAARCQDRLTQLGYHVAREHSDWVLQPDAGELQRQLVDGWARAAASIAPEHASAIDGWRTRRLEYIDRRCSRITVGHQDLAAWLE